MLNIATCSFTLLAAPTYMGMETPMETSTGQHDKSQQAPMQSISIPIPHTGLTGDFVPHTRHPP